MTLSKNISLGLASEIEKDYSMAVKAYNDMKNVKVEEVNTTFVPRMID